MPKRAPKKKTYRRIPKRVVKKTGKHKRMFRGGRACCGPCRSGQGMCGAGYDARKEQLDKLPPFLRGFGRRGCGNAFSGKLKKDGGFQRSKLSLLLSDANKSLKK